MEMTEIGVECYSGYQADEYPKSFYIGETRHEITTITDRWYQGDTDPGFPVSNYFRVITTCGSKFLIRHDLQSDKWYLCRTGI